MAGERGPFEKFEILLLIPMVPNGFCIKYVDKNSLKRKGKKVKSKQIMDKIKKVDTNYNFLKMQKR